MRRASPDAAARARRAHPRQALRRHAQDSDARHRRRRAARAFAEKLLDSPQARRGDMPALRRPRASPRGRGTQQLFLSALPAASASRTELTADLLCLLSIRIDSYDVGATIMEDEIHEDCSGRAAL